MKSEEKFKSQVFTEAAYQNPDDMVDLQVNLNKLRSHESFEDLKLYA